MVKIRKGNKIHDFYSKKFGKLTAIDLAPNGTNGKRRWNCICECGNTTIVDQINLYTSHTKSCGCLLHENRLTTSPGHAGCQKLYSNYLNSAKKRKLAFLISREEFKNLVVKNCYFCGCPPGRTSIVKVNSKISAENSRFNFNGIDRLNSRLGYFEGNIVPCCFDCNVAKFERTEEQFYEWLIKCVTHCIETKKIKVPFEIDVGVGDNFGEAHKV